MNNLLILNTDNMPALLDQDLLALGGALTKSLTGGGINRISLKGNRFRFNVSGEQVAVADGNYIDMVIAGAMPHIGRIFYKTGFDKTGADNGPPACYSSDGVRPDARVPAEQRQNANCAGCKQNIKGSKIVDGRSMRACAFKQRIVVVNPVRLEDGSAAENDLFALDVNGTSIFSDTNAAPGNRSLQGYVQYLATPQTGFPRGVSHLQVVTRIKFNDDSGTPSHIGFAVAPNGRNQPAFLDSNSIRTLGTLVRSDTYKRLLENDVADAGDDDTPVTASTTAPVTQPASAKAPATWQTIALAAGADDDDVESIEEAGGPGTEKGLKRWKKIMPEGVNPPGAATSLPPVTAPTPVAPPPLKPWKEVAAAHGADADDIESIEEAGGPGGEKGRKRWDKIVKLPLDGVDVSVEKITKVKAKKAEVAPATIADAAVPQRLGTSGVIPHSLRPEPLITMPVVTAPAVTEKPVAPLSEGNGKLLADALSAFDDDE